jgi:hypothetical protein
VPKATLTVFERHRGIVIRLIVPGALTVLKTINKHDVP